MFANAFECFFRYFGIAEAVKEAPVRQTAAEVVENLRDRAAMHEAYARDFHRTATEMVAVFKARAQAHRQQAAMLNWQADQEEKRHG